MAGNARERDVSASTRPPISSAERTRRNTFAATPLDRCSPARADPAWLARRRHAADARWLAFDANGRAPVADGHLQWLTAEQVAPAAVDNFLGELAGAPLFALRAPLAPEAFHAAHWLDLRTAAGALGADEAGLFAYAQALANWQHTTRHCAFCGGALALVDGGHRAHCDQCGRQHFPRTDAAIIVIVEHGDACLLGRQARWVPHRYSTLAGFVEPGEALADAVRREVREETGVEVLDCDFHSSQPWPFPASLMLGFTARAAARTLGQGDGELEDARWFTAPDLARELGDGSLSLPTRNSIAYRLIEHWLATRAGLELDALVRAD